MDPRGAAPTAVCPRCATEAPPTYERIVICASCNLGFAPVGELVVAPKRKELVAEPPMPERRVAIKRNTKQTKIRVAGRSWLGIVPMVGGVVGVVLAGFFETWVFQLGLVWLSAAMFLFGRSLVDAHAIVVDRRWIDTRRLPLQMTHHRLARGFCVTVDVVGTQVRALTTDNAEHLVLAAPDVETAERVAFEVRAAMLAHPHANEDDDPPPWLVR